MYQTSKPKKLKITRLEGDDLMSELLSRNDRTGADVNFEYSYELVMDQLHLIKTMKMFAKYFDIELVKWSAAPEQPEYNINEDVIKVFALYKRLLKK